MKRPVHFEILADDVEKIADFYREVLDWKISIWEGPQPYWLVETGPDGTPGINGGLMHRHYSQSVINTIEVKSLEDMLTKVEEAGGKKIEGPIEIPEVGIHAYCQDPEGNIFGLIQPAPHES